MNDDIPYADFLDRPGRSGPFGALLDEYARAAADLCDVVESIDDATFAATRESSDPDTTSLRQICIHCTNAAYGYSNAIRRVRKVAEDRSGILAADHPLDPGELRGRLGLALRQTEATVEAIWDADDKTILGLRFESPWGQIYDPETILEHGIVHLLRHRRQIERWVRGV